MQTKYAKVQADTESFHRIFRQNFVRFAAADPGPGMAYLTDRIGSTQRSWDNMRWRFNGARAVNDEVTAELNRSKAFTRFFMVAGGVAATVLGAIAPASWIVNSAGGIGYAIACQLASSIGEAMSADKVGFQYPESNIVQKTVTNSTTAASLANAGVSTTINYAQGNREGLLKVAEETAAKLERKLAEFTAQRGANLTGPQRKIGADLARKAGGIGGASNAARFASQVKYVKGASIGVGLLFMKDDFAALYRDLRVYRDVTR